MPTDPTSVRPPVMGGATPRCLVVDEAPEVVHQLHHQISRVLPGAILLPHARDGGEGLQRVRDYRPDILFLDLDMPRMSGLTTLRALAGVRPARTIVLAPETRDGGRAAWEALCLGATDFLPKRGGRGHARIDMGSPDLEDRLRALLATRVTPSDGRIVRMRTRRTAQIEIESLAALVVLAETRRLVATARRLSRLCGELPIPLLLDVPHPARFTPAIAEGLDRMTRCPVRVAVPGERLAPGHIFLVPSGQHAFIRGRRGEVDVHLAPFPGRGVAALHHRRSIRALLDPEGTAGGIALTTPPSRWALVPARQAARQGRLFYLSYCGDRKEAPCLRAVERVALRRSPRAA